MNQRQNTLPVESPREDSQFDLRHLQDYWSGVHREVAATQRAESLQVENRPWLVNAHEHLGHWLGMRANLRVVGPLAGRCVLDLGCGRGRWSALFARQGARVTGVDWSAEAVAHAAHVVRSANFRCMSIAELDFPDAAFDVANTVTVIQHLPAETHARIFAEAARVLRPGGFLLCIEMIVAQRGPHMFPRTAEGWADVARGAALELVAQRGCSYELLTRPYKALVRKLYQRFPSQAQATSQIPDGQPPQLSLRQRARRIVEASVALPSMPLEILAQALPMRFASHAAMVFRKPRK